MDTETGESTPLFSDGENRSFGFPWSAPELDGDDAIVLRTDPETGFGTDIEVYRRDVGGDWVLWNRLPDICPGYPYTTSPEPFLFAGRSYVTMVAYTEGENCWIRA